MLKEEGNGAEDVGKADGEGRPRGQPRGHVMRIGSFPD